jgi:hypothetical protein
MDDLIMNPDALKKAGCSAVSLSATFAPVRNEALLKALARNPGSSLADVGSGRFRIDLELDERGLNEDDQVDIESVVASVKGPLSWKTSSIFQFDSSQFATPFGLPTEVPLPSEVGIAEAYVTGLRYVLKAKSKDQFLRGGIVEGILDEAGELRAYRVAIFGTLARELDQGLLSAVLEKAAPIAKASVRPKGKK